MFEKLDVYKVAVELRESVMRSMGKRGSRDLRDQFRRASSSVILNLCEGAGRWEAADKRRFFVIARGSAFETAGALTLLRQESALNAREYSDAKQLVIRVMQMLTKLCQHPVASAPVEPQHEQKQEAGR
jgi:four helix bundle protein